jgi:hypothetical protein
MYSEYIFFVYSLYILYTVCYNDCILILHSIGGVGRE